MFHREKKIILTVQHLRLLSGNFTHCSSHTPQLPRNTSNGYITPQRCETWAAQMVTQAIFVLHCCTAAVLTYSILDTALMYQPLFVQYKEEIILKM